MISSLLPGPKRLGRPREVDLREVWNAIGYLAALGCAWALLPKDFPVISAVRYFFYHWRNTGLLREINRRLVATEREAVGRDSCPTAGVIDSKSVKIFENTTIFGCDADKKIKGCKRHIMVDTCGNLLELCVHTADIQDRDGPSTCFGNLSMKPRNYAMSLRMVAMQGQSCAMR